MINIQQSQSPPQINAVSSFYSYNAFRSAKNTAGMHNSLHRPGALRWLVMAHQAVRCIYIYIKSIGLTQLHKNSAHDAPCVCVCVLVHNVRANVWLRRAVCSIHGVERECEEESGGREGDEWSVRGALCKLWCKCKRTTLWGWMNVWLRAFVSN